MSVKVKLSGLEELDKQLRTLPLKVQRRAMIAGLREGAKVYKKAGKLAAPVRQWSGDASAKFIGKSHGLRLPGFLKRTLVYRTITPKNAIRPTIHLGPRRAAFYGQFFEVGRRGRRRMPRKNFLSDAYRQRSSAALDAVRRGLWAALAKELKKIG